MNEFDKWSEWYDFMNKNKISEQPDLHFYQDLLNKHGEPGLELACGTGRLLLEHLKDGYNVHGIDISSEMLNITKEKFEKENVQTKLYEQDIRELDISRKYPVVYYPFNSLSHFTTVSDQIKVFNNIYEIVEDDGVFAFDIYVPDIQKMNNYGKLIRKEREHNGKTYIFEIWEDWESKSEQIFKHYNRIINPESNEIEWQVNFTLSILPKQQLELLLINAGFTDYTFYHEFSDEPLKKDSNHMSVIVKK